jgi:hypothetical protein
MPAANRWVAVGLHQTLIENQQASLAYEVKSCCFPLHSRISFPGSSAKSFLLDLKLSLFYSVSPQFSYSFLQKWVPRSHSNKTSRRLYRWGA